jgi:hypothetical protein
MSLRATPLRHRFAGAGLLVVALTAVPSTSWAAPPTFTAVSLDAVVVGSTVRVSTVVRASTDVGVDRYGVCARSAGGEDEDFDFATDVVISTGGTPYERSKSLPAGSHTYFACVDVDGGWHNVGSPKTVTVPAPSKSETGGWTRTFAEEFATPVNLGGFVDSSYAARWFAYDGYRDTSGRGLYDPDRVLSVHDGMLDWYVHTANRLPLVSAVVARSPQTGWGQKYGRYSFRFRSDLLPGYKLVGMLWPDSDNWAEGEVDFPEVGALDADNHVYANLYQPGNLASGLPGPSTGFRSAVAAAGTGWHAATIEWTPDRLTFTLDGATLGTLRGNVPATSFHLVLQVETSIGGAAPASATAGHVNVDSVTIDTYTP